MEQDAGEGWTGHHRSVVFMGILTRGYAAIGEPRMAAFIENFTFDLDLPCKSGYWPVIAVTLYLMMVTKAYIYNEWGGKRARSSVEATKCFDPETRRLVTAAHASFLTVEEFQAGLGGKMSLEDAKRQKSLLKTTPYKRVMVTAFVS